MSCSFGAPTLDAVLHAVLQQQRGVDPQRRGAEGADNDGRQQRDDAGRDRHQRVPDHQRAERQRRAPQQVVRPDARGRVRVRLQCENQDHGR